ncbi:MAG: hypothetical protein FJ148_00405 [Deltaproteobacteria bacterium]|nr:hypothetical protein [Deltaproteobacteria bacterium]
MTTDTETLLAARDRYLRDNGFDSSYEERWVKLKAGPIPIWFPNAPGRVRAVKLHDLHHLVTGYATDWTGEAEIGAWEIASGCGSFAWAWALNLAAIPIGLMLSPRRVFRAWVRGRRSRNFYRGRTEVDDAMPARRVGAMRAEMGLDAPVPSATFVDVATFVAAAALATAVMLGPTATILALFLASRA